MNILTGIADEAANSIDEQIRAHQILGWRAIELRTIDGQNVAGELSDDAFEDVYEKLSNASMQVTGFASAIGNWSRPIDDDFSVDVNELKTAAKRMQRLGTKYIRTMSWLQGDCSEQYWKEETIRRYCELAQIAQGHDIYLAHENCTGWAGQSAQHTRTLLEEVNNDHLKVLFDIGNTISHGYEPWEFYNGVKDVIGYVHVKDCKRAPQGGRSQDYRLPGEGDAQLKEILQDLLKNGYDGVISIEPHIAKVIHEGQDANSETMFQSYLDYARRFEGLVEDVRKNL